MSTAAPEHSCAFSGQQDFHGLGIRIGFYLQWISTALAFSYLPAEFPGLAIMSFLIATAVATAFLVHYEEIYATEALILTSILMIPQQLCLIEFLDFITFRFKRSRTTMDWTNDPYEYHWIERAADITRLLATLFLLGVVIWAFFFGMDVMTHHPHCDPTLLGLRYLSGSPRMFLKVFSVLLVAGCLFERLFFIIAKWHVSSISYISLTSVSIPGTVVVIA